MAKHSRVEVAEMKRTFLSLVKMQNQFSFLGKSNRKSGNFKSIGTIPIQKYVSSVHITYEKIDN